MEEEAEEEEVHIFCIIEIIVCFSTLPPSEVFVLVLVSWVALSFTYKGHKTPDLRWTKSTDAMAIPELFIHRIEPNPIELNCIGKKKQKTIFSFFFLRYPKIRDKSHFLFDWKKKPDCTVRYPKRKMGR